MTLLLARASFFIGKENRAMMVSETMTTKLVIVRPDDSLSHAANLLREHQFHHLPVAQIPGKSYYWFPGEVFDTQKHTRDALPVLEGLITSEDIEIAAAVSDEHPADAQFHRWQERQVVEVMHPVPLSVAPTTNVAVAARILVERGLNCLPVVEYADSGKAEQPLAVAQESRMVLVGLLTRSDLQMAMSRALGTAEPGIDILIPLPARNVMPLARMLMITVDLHMQVHSIIAAPLDSSVPHRATVRLGTIYPAPLLVRLQAEGIQYEFANILPEDDVHA